MSKNYKTPTCTYLSLSILGGKFIKEVPAGTDKAVQCTNETGGAIYSDFVEGVLKDIRTYNDGENGTQWLLALQNGIDIYFLKIGEDVKFLPSLIMNLSSYDLKKPIMIHSYICYKNYSGVNLSQDGKTIGKLLHFNKQKKSMIMTPAGGKNPMHIFLLNTNMTDFLRQQVEMFVMTKFSDVFTAELSAHPAHPIWDAAKKCLLHQENINILKLACQFANN
jgi:hypothetical protein